MLEQLQTIVREYIDDPNFKLSPDTVLLNDLGLDSFDLVQLACDVEEYFDIEIPDRIISKFKTIADVLNFVSQSKPEASLIANS